MSRVEQPPRREIAFTASDYARLRTHVLDGGEDEEGAILLAGISRSEHAVRLLVRDIVAVPDGAFVHKGRTGLTIHPDFLAPLVKRCRNEALAFVLVHSHPFTGEGVRFSSIDNAGEAALFPRIQARVPGVPTAAIVFGRAGLDARMWLPGEWASQPVARITVVGDRLDHIVPTGAAVRGTDADQVSPDRRHARQELALGAASRSALRALRVIVVGAGGLGSLVYQQLTHLGVGRVDAVDPDLLEESNLSRVVWSTPSDVGRPKVEVLVDGRQRTVPGAWGEAIVGDVTHAHVATYLRDADVLVCATDNLTSRLVLNRLAHQYYVPLIDLGVDVQLRAGDTSRVRAIGGRVMLITPDGPCLGCLGMLDLNALAREGGCTVHLGYLAGQPEPAPSVIGFNGVVASLAVVEFLRLVTGYAEYEVPVYQRYDGVRGLVRTYALQAEEACTVCAEVRGMGDRLALPVREAA